MRGVAHMKASCCTYARVIQVARMHEACEYDLNQGRPNRERDRERHDALLYARVYVTLYIRISHVAHRNKICQGRAFTLVSSHT